MDVSAKPARTKTVGLASNDQMSLVGEPQAMVTVTDVTNGRKSIATTDHLYQGIENLPEARELGRLLLEKEEVCFDTETTSLDIRSAELIGISFSFEAGKAYYVPLPEERDAAQPWLAAFEPFFESESVRKIGQNLKYDIGVLLNYGVEVRGPLFDTMIAHYLLQPDMRHKMDILAETYLNYTTITYESVVGKKGKMQKTLREVTLEAVTDYAAEDADITLQLKEGFAPKLKETGVAKVFENIEMPLVPVLSRMEREGIKVDVAALNSYSHELGQLIEALEETIVALAGRPFNVGSPRQLGEVLFEDLKLSEKPKKTKTGQYATSEDILQGYRDKHELVDSILTYRELKKLKSTYVDALPELVHLSTGRIHTSYNQTVAATGRLSSTNPNLQNITIRTENGSRVRAMIVPADETNVLRAADYSQIEGRVLAA